MSPRQPTSLYIEVFIEVFIEGHLTGNMVVDIGCLDNTS